MTFLGMRGDNEAPAPLSLPQPWPLLSPIKGSACGRCSASLPPERATFLSSTEPSHHPPFHLVAVFCFTPPGGIRPASCLTRGKHPRTSRCLESHWARPPPCLSFLRPDKLISHSFPPTHPIRGPTGSIVTAANAFCPNHPPPSPSEDLLGPS